MRKPIGTQEKLAIFADDCSVSMHARLIVFEHSDIALRLVNWMKLTTKVPYTQKVTNLLVIGIPGFTSCVNSQLLTPVAGEFAAGQRLVVRLVGKVIILGRAGDSSPRATTREEYRCMYIGTTRSVMLSTYRSHSCRI